MNKNFSAVMFGAAAMLCACDNDDNSYVKVDGAVPIMHYCVQD